MTRIGGVFVSYARSDAAAALRLYDALTTAGHDVWLDAHDVRPGVHWWDAAKRAIERRPSVVFLESAASSRSFWCGEELAYALARGKRIVRLDAAGTEDLGTAAAARLPHDARPPHSAER